jgi:CRP-like cAMP-binding protein
MSTAQAFFREQGGILRNADKSWHLQQTGLTDGLSLREMHVLAAACTDQILPKDQVVFHRGSHADYMYFVNRGTVRLLVTTQQGREKIVDILSTGDVFGEEVLSASDSRQTQAVAHEETWISMISREAMKRLLVEIPALSLNLLNILNQRLVEARNEIEVLSFSGTERRIARTLLRLCKNHGKSIAAAEGLRKIKIPMSHELLAQMIGANRPHVSAIMSEFKKRGWIEYQKRKLLVNTKELDGFLSLQGGT